MNDNQPSYGVFLHRKTRVSWAAIFLRNLEPGIPVKVEIKNPDKPLNTLTLLRAKAKDLKIVIRTVKFGSDYWVCRIKDEDISKVK